MDTGRFTLSIRKEWLALALIVLLAIAVRFFRIDTTPPGLHYDEAFNNLNALRVVQSGHYPVFFPENNGEEPLHIYLIAALFALTGPSPLGGRLVSAASGVVTVIALYGLGVELFRHFGRPAAGRLALLASLFLATWYWSFHYNRIGMEPSMVPMTGTLAMWFIWRAFRTRRAWDVMLAGTFTALSLYTYPPGRLQPIAAGLALAGHIAIRREGQKQRLRLALGIVATALVVFLPLGLFFVRQPELFFHRIQQTAGATVLGIQPVDAAVQGAASTVLGFFWRGDMNWRQNLPGRPMFDLAQLAFLLVGVMVSLWSARARPALLFVLLWAALALLPTVLTEYPPHFGRALGATPPLALVVALGMWTFAGWASRLRHGRYLATAVIGLALAFSGGRALDDYFRRWGRAPELFSAFDVGLRAIGEYAVRLPRRQPIYLSPVPNDWYTLTYAMNDDSPRLRSFNGRECLVFPERTDDPAHLIVILIPGEDPRSLRRLQAIFPAGKVRWHVSKPDAPYAVDYVVPPGQTAVFQPQHPLYVNFDNQAEMLGYDLSAPVARPGQTMTVSVWWRSTAPFSKAYTVYIHLYGPANPATGSTLWAQQDTQPCLQSYPTTRWVAGDIIWDDYRLQLPSDLPTETFTITAGMYELNGGARLPILSATAPFQDQSVFLTNLRIEAP